MGWCPATITQSSFALASTDSSQDSCLLTSCLQASGYLSLSWRYFSIRGVVSIQTMLNPVKKFKKNYRNVLVIEKLTFPDEKVLRLEISENQISGRVITLTIEYEDILNADGFDSDILKNSSCYPYYYIYR